MAEHRGPTPPTGRSYCILCAAGWKAKAFKLAAERRVDMNADINLAALMTGQPLPALAVADGPVALPVPPSAGQPPGTTMVVTAPLCWTHLIPIEIVDTVLTLASAAAGPFGGAHLLGR